MQNNEQPTEGGFRAGIETGPDGKPSGNIICYPSFNPNCIVVTLPTDNLSTGFLSLPSPTKFHDEVLIKATKEMNDILAKVAQQTSQDSRKTSLHLFLADEGPMLIWVDSMAMETNDIRKVPEMAHSW
ncbi:hypothetical protein [Spirosoma sp. KNUC1025]|uniref:hypothetical protein n=1 Tax=Spirosoma sp. KNUC1025 TaxID=2894082 RepID=UPI003868C2BC|nr:hypothetical protein LN737_32325 [Spirosoma sp. KNUC1025]